MKYDITPEPFHFFVVNCGSWRVSRPDLGLPQLLRSFTNLGDCEFGEFEVWLVPGKWDSHYSIKSYRPQVAGAVCLGKFDKRVQPLTMGWTGATAQALIDGGAAEPEAVFRDGRPYVDLAVGDFSMSLAEGDSDTLPVGDFSMSLVEGDSDNV